MKNYEKPVVMVNEGLAEGVYAASGTASDCIISHDVQIVQRPDHGATAGRYIIKATGQHNAVAPLEAHWSDARNITINFNDVVTYGNQTGSTIIANIPIEKNETSGLGDASIEVTYDGDERLEIISYVMDCVPRL